MTQSATYRNGLWGGRPLLAWVNEVVADLVAAADPLRIILFGSVAEGTAGPDSDIDLLVVLPDSPPAQRWRQVADLHAAVTVPVPVDILVTDPDEIARRAHLSGSMLQAALRDGVVVYERSD